MLTIVLVYPSYR